MPENQNENEKKESMQGNSKFGKSPCSTVSEYPSRVIVDLRTACNLRCQMCPLWGPDDETTLEAQSNLSGSMPLEKAGKVLDEIMGAKPLVHPQLYGEPLLARNFRDHICGIKKRNLSIAINTNGLLLNESMAEFLVEMEVDAVFISIDAITKETLEKVRGIDQLPKIEKAVERLLKSRGLKELPRIGVSFTVQDENRHEMEPFIKKWIESVDCVRVGSVFTDGKLQGVSVPASRVPCPAIYMTMPIQNNGDVPICCIDSHAETNMGNVFEDGVRAVWHGEKFTEVRKLHEAGRYEDIPICKNCNRWASYLYEEEVRENILVRRSPEYVYYNRVDRMTNWTSASRGGHEASGLGLTSNWRAAFPSGAARRSRYAS